MAVSLGGGFLRHFVFAHIYRIAGFSGGARAPRRAALRTALTRGSASAAPQAVRAAGEENLDYKRPKHYIFLQFLQHLQCTKVL